MVKEAKLPYVGPRNTPYYRKNQNFFSTLEKLVMTATAITVFAAAIPFAMKAYKREQAAQVKVQLHESLKYQFQAKNQEDPINYSTKPLDSMANIRERPASKSTSQRLENTLYSKNLLVAEQKLKGIENEYSSIAKALLANPLQVYDYFEKIWIDKHIQKNASHEGSLEKGLSNIKADIPYAKFVAKESNDDELRLIVLTMAETYGRIQKSCMGARGQLQFISNTANANGIPIKYYTLKVKDKKGREKLKAREVLYCEPDSYPLALWGAESELASKKARFPEKDMQNAKYNSGKPAKCLEELKERRRAELKISGIKEEKIQEELSRIKVSLSAYGQYLGKEILHNLQMLHEDKDLSPGDRDALIKDLSYIWENINYVGKTRAIDRLLRTTYAKLVSVPARDLYQINTLEFTPETYVVQKGDTLYSIAKKKNVSHKSLAALNSIEDGSISKGIELEIPLNREQLGKEIEKHSGHPLEQIVRVSKHLENIQFVVTPRINYVLPKYLLGQR